MIYLLYLLTAAGVVYLSNKASDYVDWLDKTTSLSGAFIGGILLSAVTSLPELFTSVSSTVFLDQPGLCIGNILGSNLFNLAVLSFFIAISCKSFAKNQLAKGQKTVSLFVLVIYAFLILNQKSVFSFEFLTISITSLVIGVLYYFAAKNLSSDSEESSVVSEEHNCPYTLKQLIIRFVLVSVGIIGLSIVITFLTDKIADELNLGTGLAGALFLGIATSLPEVSSTVALFRLKNYDIAVGNIIGSNLFNFLVLLIADLFYFGNGIYDFTDPKTLNLLYFGLAASALFFVFMHQKQNGKKILWPAGVMACYFGFLIF